MGNTVNDSRFYMWRAIFAMAHADGVVTAEETEFLSEYLASVPFSQDQKAILLEDMKHPQDIAEMFSKIADAGDKSQFFFFSRMLVWSDGDFDIQEKLILDKLKKTHLSSLDMEDISKSVKASAALVAEDLKQGGHAALDFWETVRKFQDNFGNKG